MQAHVVHGAVRDAQGGGARRCSCADEHAISTNCAKCKCADHNECTPVASSTAKANKVGRHIAQARRSSASESKLPVGVEVWVPQPPSPRWRQLALHCTYAALTIYGGAPYFILLQEQARSVSGTLLPSCIAHRTSNKMMQLAAASLRALAPRVAPLAACTGAARELLGEGVFSPVHAYHQRVISMGGCC